MGKNKTYKKVAWEDIYKDFRLRHPNLAKMVMHWTPRDYLKIQIHLNDGMILLYDYLDHRAGIIKGS